ncbi:hypothetical protein GCM10010420_42250 [Streptomyces glaucosporus]|uniref:Secreted protein n=1 Tax=Streptomyces glaucosporus TaxID=284044 RepID=A0ABP5VQJ2_9ACTN
MSCGGFARAPSAPYGYVAGAGEGSAVPAVRFRPVAAGVWGGSPAGGSRRAPVGMTCPSWYGRKARRILWIAVFRPGAAGGVRACQEMRGRPPARTLSVCRPVVL